MELIPIGLQLTVYGMGLVFLLLLLLWGVMSLLLRLDRPPAAAPGPAVAAETAAGSNLGKLGRAVESLTPEKVSAIAIAVLLHRSLRRKQAAPAMRTHWPGTLPSRWVVAGRTRQTQDWHPHRR